MGRKNLFASRADITIEDIVESYRKHKNVQKVGAELHLSMRTVSKYLHEYGVELPPAKRPGKHMGCFALWLRKNPGVELPRSPAEVAAITGCSVDSIKSYVYRRKKLARLWISDLPDIRETPLLLKGKSSGKMIPTRKIQTYRLTVNFTSLKYHFDAIMDDGTVEDFFVSGDALRQALKEVGKL